MTNDKLHAAMAGFVARGEIPGIVTLVARGDDVLVDALGTTTTDRRQPMRRDTIFRIASLTKPIAAAATMILVDDAVLRLDDAVDRWLPELANRRVLKRIDAQLDDTVPARRAITVRDVLSSCFGFGVILAPPGSYPIQRPIREGQLGGDGHPHQARMPAPDEWMRRLGALPLMSQPGERWLYDTSCDLMGVLVARASGRSLSSFLDERLFGPLGMNDTGFSVPASKLARLAAAYDFNQATGKLEVFDPTGPASEWSAPPAFESGAAGLVSTVDDYFAFCRMMLRKGVDRSGRERVLSQASVEAMTRDQLTPEQRQGADIFFGTHSSWGFGMAVNVRASGEPWVVPGRFGWDGGYGTSGYSDPKNDLVGILLTQRLMDSPEPPAVFRAFWAGVYGKMVVRTDHDSI